MLKAGQKVEEKKQAVAKDKAEVVEVDIFSDNIEDLDSCDVDLEADAFARSAPIPAGDYTGKLIRSKDNAELKEYNGEKYYSIPFEHVIESEDKAVNGTRLDGKVTTRVGRSGTSTCITVLTRLGIAVPSNISHGDQAKLFAQVLKKESKIKFRVDWEAQVATEKEDGSTDWNTARYQGKLLNTYENFPDAEGGGKEYRVSVKDANGDPVDVTARARVVEYYFRKKKEEVEGLKVVTKKEKEEKKSAEKVVAKPADDDDEFE